MLGKKVLLAESDQSQWSAVGKIFVESGCEFSAVEDGGAAFKEIAGKRFDLIIADVDLPQINGLDLLKRIRRINQSMPVILTSANACVEEAVEAMKLGALDFLLKPLTPKVIQVLTDQTGATDCPRTESSDIASKNGRYKIITNNKEMKRLIKTLDRVADSPASIFIQGESGTGKELFARKIHHSSRRRNQPFIAINCAALPETLLESELFGHEKGAFTGAINRKKGKFELANHGTLLLDEISEMDIGLQSKLLRVLQEREIDRVGGVTPIPVDVRIIATTNRDIEVHIQEGKFREDLYYRLNVIPIYIPPLRDRPEDIPLLANYFVNRYNEIDSRDIKGLTEDGMQYLLQMPWKGNVRELENITERAVLMCTGDFIDEEILQFNGNTKSVEAADHPFLPSLNTVSLKEVEKKTIFHALDRTNGNRTHAAEILGISVRTLRNKLNEYRSKMDV